ncbi:MAG: glycoside hydrolase family 3 C-terminal domain-containing protein [Oscillospiraceae bacterium]|jgi:beta-glucosidase|nr:glycoside hydrolase family 3 C-terminal domain-containing protein [Oscillospiraceae bacterium]
MNSETIESSTANETNAANESAPWLDTTKSFEERAALLTAAMTLEEKISQMTYYSSAVPRLGVYEYNWWNECLHGVARAGIATMFPQTIGMAASFDTELLAKIAHTIGLEARVKHHAAESFEDRGIYKGLTFWTPNINIFRDPRWGRGHETYGEDPFLTSRMGVAFIKALQGDDPRYTMCDATAKHYAVHSGPENDRHHFDAQPSKKDLYETYLPAFKAAVKEGGVHAVMGAYNRVYGEAANASTFLLGKTLREEWGFEGYVVSDCGAIEDIWEHHKIAGTPEEAAALAVNNGCDLCCGKIFEHLHTAVEKGLITEETISQSVTRLMTSRMRLGMFDPIEDQPLANLPYSLLDSKPHHSLSRQMARDSLVLLKNDGILPMDPASVKTVAVIGPNADSRAALIGNYTGTPSITYTVMEGLREVAPGVRFILAEGCALTGGSAEEPWGESASFRIAEAMKAAAEADVSIVVTGLTGEKEGEEGYGSGDRTSMHLPESQRDLIEALASMGKPMVLVNMTGSATLFPREGAFGAIMQAWYPGQFGGLAVAEALFGKFSPNGRLPVTFYASMEQVPDFADYSMKGRTYRYLEGEPAYPFGYGLSYTWFRYEDIKIARSTKGLTIGVTIRNVGDTAGKEAAQVYIKWIDADTATPAWQLAGFRKVTLSPGKSRRLTFTVTLDQLAVIDDDGNHRPHIGRYEVAIGGGQPDARTEALTGQSVYRQVV